MSRRQQVPEGLAHLTDLSLDATGTFVLYATDDYFAPKENLVKPSAPEWREGEYTDRGKWMDGWESQRRRTPGHDHAILRLGTPGVIHAILCDTTHFKGNAPQEIALEAVEAPVTATVQDLDALPVAADEAALAQHGGRAWLEVIPRTAVQPDHANVLRAARTLKRASHVRLRIFPDGGVSRLRVYGRVIPDPRVFWRPGSIDLAAIENGGAVAAVSDAFFGPPSNLLLPGRGVDMGSGWETKRRRTPGSDWCVLELGRRGRVERIELDTHFFKGNAPQAAMLEYFDAEGARGDDIARALADAGSWRTLLELTPLVPHHRHVIEPAQTRIATHLRVHILPHGGVNRARVFGHAVDTPGERSAIAALNALSSEPLRTLLQSFCGAKAFVDGAAGRFPVASVRDLFAATAAAFEGWSDASWLEAFAAHPRLGDGQAPREATGQSATWSKSEQSAIARGDDDTRARLAAGNETYAVKFGFTFIAFASGRGAREVLELLEQRIGNDREQELANAAREQMRITRQRIAVWLLANGAG